MSFPIPQLFQRSARCTAQTIRQFSSSSSRGQNGSQMNSATQQLFRQLTASTTRSRPAPTQTPSPKSPNDALSSLSSPSTTSPQPSTGTASLQRDLAFLSRSGDREAKLREIETSTRRRELDMQQMRKWKVGDVYAPHDLSSVEARKWKKIIRRPRVDVFDQLGLNPLDEYKNVALLGEFVTETGKIKHNRLTGLRPVNQRKIAKAVRRGVACGMLPSVHKHPEFILRERVNRGLY